MRSSKSVLSPTVNSVLLCSLWSRSFQKCHADESARSRFIAWAAGVVTVETTWHLLDDETDPPQAQRIVDWYQSDVDWPGPRTAQRQTHPAASTEWTHAELVAVLNRWSGVRRHPSLVYRI